MKYLYTEFIINGEKRIGEIKIVSDDTPGASLTGLKSITDEIGREVYQLQNNEPVKVGPIQINSQNEKNSIIGKKLINEYSIEKSIYFLVEICDFLLNGGAISGEANSFLNRMKNLKGNPNG